MLLYAKEITEQRSEFGREYRSAITDDSVRKAMILHHHVDNHFRKSWSIAGNFDWLIMHYFSQMVDNDEN